MSLVSTGLPFVAPALVESSPGVGNVILTATNQYRLSSHDPDFHPEGGDLNLLTVAAGLAHSGFKRIAVTDTRREGFVPDLERQQRLILDGFARLGAGEQRSVIGISTTTEELFKYRVLSQILRGRFPGAQIIAGGSHFVREEIPGSDGYVDPVEETLRAGSADAVVVGHAQPFVDFVAKHGGRRDEVEAPGFYQLDPASGGVLGHGGGEYPALSSVPYDLRPDKRSMRVLLSNACGNGCDYCAGAKAPNPLFSTDMVVEGLMGVIGAGGVTMLHLADPNPFDRGVIDYYGQTFDRMDDVKTVMKSSYLDAAALVSEESRERAEAMMSKNIIWHLFVGRDQVTEEGAGALGRRYRGRLKDQRMLDAERDRLIDFIKGVRERCIRFGVTVPHRFMLSYVVSHMETMETALAAYEDMRTFLALDGFGADIAITIHSLMPYPGTRIRRKFKDAIDLADFDFFRDAGDRLTPWKRDAGPGVELMRRAAKIDRSRGARMTVDEFKKAIDQSF